MPEIGDGEALVRTEWISLDPTNRAWIGERRPTCRRSASARSMRAVGLGRVVASKHPGYAEGAARPGADRLAGVRRRLRRRAAAASMPEVDGRLAERLPRRARHDRASPRGSGCTTSASRRRARRSSSPPRPARSARSPGSSRSATAPASSASPAARRSARC